MIFSLELNPSGGVWGYVWGYRPKQSITIKINTGTHLRSGGQRRHLP